MNIERILKNPVSILIGATSTGKTMLLSNLMAEYIAKYTGRVYCYGVRREITKEMPVIPFSSVVELEQIQDGIIVVDEVGALFDLDNRKQKRMIESTLRLVNHHNNKLVLSGLPSDFRKFLSAKATCFMYTSLTLSDLINGSLAKTTLLEYREEGMGAYTLDVPVGSFICYVENEIKNNKTASFQMDIFKYIEKFDTKRKNGNLFEKRS